MAVIQYPYSLKVFVESEAQFDDTKGEWIPGESSWQDWGKCRDEVAGSGAKINTEDGEVYEYGWTVYCPKSTQRITKGTKIRVIDTEGIVRAEKSVLRFSKDQLHVRIWL
ncbi:hypothetical protein [Elizabethkingia anophelis]|uniref:hypothetical protein n=1 Tax=Elizabethkingia anophelis TaxID=1117645 RepID=UPI0038915DD9